MTSPFSPFFQKAIHRWIFVLISLLGGCGIIHRIGLDDRGELGTRLYYGVTHFDSVLLLVEILFLFFLLFFLPFFPSLQKNVLPAPFPALLQKSTFWIAISSLIIFTGFQFIVRGYAFSLDEWAVLFQSKIFLQGHTHQLIPEIHQPLSEALTPYLILHDSLHQTWISFYLPIHTLFFTLFEFFKIGWALNLVLTAATSILLLQIHDLLWPEKKASRFWIPLLILTTPQILCMAMSYFSMTSHLFMNTLWLRLFLEKGKKRVGLLPVSFLALGLHQPFIHGLFIAPFLVRWFFGVRHHLLRLGVTLFYLSALGFWIGYWNHSNPLFSAHSSMIGLPNPLTVMNQLCHLIRLVSWLSPLIGIGLILLSLSRPKIPPFFQDLLFGTLLTFAFYFCFELSQGRGWGFRYAHGILQNLILLSLLGFYSLPGKEIDFIHRLWNPLLLYSFLIVYPLKGAEMLFELDPYRRADQKIREMKIPYVILSPRDAWYSNDLIRNTPDLHEAPLRLNADRLSESQYGELIRSGKAIRLDPNFYESCGIPLLKILKETQGHF